MRLLLAVLLLAGCVTNSRTADGICEISPLGAFDAADPDCMEFQDGRCDWQLNEDPDCIGGSGCDDPPCQDGVCDCDSGLDPDCTFCDCNQGDEECLEWFEPNQVDVDGSFAFDPITGTAVPYLDDEGELRDPEITLVVYSVDYASSQTRENACGLRLTPKPDLPPVVDWHAFTARLSGTDVDYRHYGMTLLRGEYDISDYTRDDRILGCLEVQAESDDLSDGRGGFRTAVFGEDFAGLVGLQDWGVYVGAPSIEIANWLANPDSDNPDDPTDLFSLNRDGYVLGGSQQASAHVGTQAFFYSTGLALDEDFALIETGDADDPFERLPAAAMLPIEGERPEPAARGVYTVQSALYIWQAKSLLLGTN